MDVLESLLRPVADAINKNIPEVTRARELCAKLEGTRVAIRVSGTSLATMFVVHADSISISTAIDDDPDIVITGSLLTLGRLVATGDAAAIRDGSVDLIGDAETAQAFQELLQAARPDVEEGLSTVIGDAAAHTLGEIGRNTQRWATDTGATMGANLREYLQEESRDAPSRVELERFADDVSHLRDDVERIAARIARLGGETR